MSGLQTTRQPARRPGVPKRTPCPSPELCSPWQVPPPPQGHVMGRNGGSNPSISLPTPSRQASLYCGLKTPKQAKPAGDPGRGSLMGSVCGQTAPAAPRCWHHVASPAPAQPQGSPGPPSTWPCAVLCALRSSCPKQLAARHRASTPQWAPHPPHLRAQPVLLPGVVPDVRYLGSRKTAGQADGLIKEEPADVNHALPLVAHLRLIFLSLDWGAVLRSTFLCQLNTLAF